MVILPGIDGAAMNREKDKKNGLTEIDKER
jgi:hypothetical protein